MAQKSAMSAGDKTPGNLSVCPRRNIYPPSFSWRVLGTGSKAGSKEVAMQGAAVQGAAAQVEMANDKRAKHQAEKAGKIGLVRAVLPHPQSCKETWC
jgi:hypothetical protein